MDDDKKYILIVDDEEPIRNLLKQVLSDQSVELLDAASGEEALAIVKRQSLDMVITDLRMPGMSGCDLLLEIHDRFPQMPVLVITGKPTLDAAVECMKGGAIDFLIKPFNITEFKEMVVTALAERDLTRSAGQMLSIERLKSIAGYTLDGLLGEGTSGVVFKAIKNDTVRALKVFKFITLTETRSLELRERFLREGNFLLETNHPHIVRVHEHGFSQSGVPYLVMDLLDGFTLKRYIKEKRFSMEDSLEVLRQVAGAIAYIHEKGVIHRDVKPENIMVMKRDGELFAILTDFGIMRDQDSNLTVAANIMGSPAYLSPEGFISPKVGIESDVFSLGVVAYELLLGERPFKAEDLFTMASVVMTELPIRPTMIKGILPDGLEEWLARSLHKDLDVRFKDCEEMGEFLDHVRDPANVPRPEGLPPLDGPNWDDEQEGY
jgi:serine/threonine protein kinase